MPFIARTGALSELALRGGLVDPRADTQPSFAKRMNCRDVTDFISNPTKFPSLGSSQETTAWDTRRKPASEHQTKLDNILARLVVSGGLSRSPAFDCLPVASHWTDRNVEASAEDPAATVRLSSTWGTIHVMGEGTTMASPLGAPGWSLKTHGIGTVEAGSNKFSQQYCPETDTLTTTVNLARRPDTAQTGGVLAAVASASWMRNTRVADAVDCAAGLLADASALLEARNKVITIGRTERLGFAEVRPAVLPSWCSVRKPLPPKLSGVALSPDEATANLVAAEGCEGPLLNTSIFSMGIGYNRGVYGGSITGLWALMDAGFVIDYSVGVTDTAMAGKLSSAFSDVAAIAEVSASAGPHMTDIRIVKGCNYGCLRQKTVIEDTQPAGSRPCMVVWDDLARLARYKLADAVFCHVYYDAGGGEYMAAIAGLGCVVHDWIDIGADVSCGEVSNIIPTLTRGSLDEGPLAEVYSRLLGVMIWYRDNDPYNPAALCLLFTHWWQLANCRHRPIGLLGRTDLGVSAGVAGTVPGERPSLEHFRACGTPVDRGERPFANAEARLQAVLSSNPLPETPAVIDLLVNPMLAYMKGADSLPTESEYVGAVLATELAYPHDQKIIELWDLAIIMWECGSMWAAGVAGLCYTHTGKANCDRARYDLNDTTWN
ncbi:unnamed protein product [Penicillium egyptiacum]|uniref:Uncharacterized protein n=1 Tax=Penicillium egyptiacum TaxID=1303716 RepID=A0A9W4KR93_9EURO|nr:unnamed protein product [Penicillium egyptiacum]